MRFTFWAVFIQSDLKAEMIQIFSFSGFSYNLAREAVFLLFPIKGIGHSFSQHTAGIQHSDGQKYTDCVSLWGFSAHVSNTATKSLLNLACEPCRYLTSRYLSSPALSEIRYKNFRGYRKKKMSGVTLVNSGNKRNANPIHFISFICLVIWNCFSVVFQKQLLMAEVFNLWSVETSEPIDYFWRRSSWKMIKENKFILCI